MRNAAFRRLCLTLWVLALCACSVEPKLSDKSVLYVDNWTRRNNPDVYVQPMQSPPVPMTALMVPFQVTQDIAGAPELGEQVTRIIWQTWSRDRVFPKLLFEPEMRLATTAQAVAKARAAGVDLAIVGKITYIMSGGTRGDSGVSFTFDAIDVKTGERLWSMAHAGTLETGLNEDFILFIRKNRMPLDPVYAITTTLAYDMGGMMIKWNYGFKPPAPAGPNPQPPAAQPTAQPIRQTPGQTTGQAAGQPTGQPLGSGRDLQK